jgi:hypothetical protein
MPRTGAAILPLYYGKAPRWLSIRITLPEFLEFNSAMNNTTEDT